jgi:hypothetical protein
MIESKNLNIFLAAINLSGGIYSDSKFCPATKLFWGFGCMGSC